MAGKQKFFLFIFLIVALLIALAMPSVRAQPVERVIRVEASEYAFTPSVFRANPGDRITIELVSKDVVHGLTVDGYPEVNLQAEPGITARNTFIAHRAGTFKVRCTVPCGNLHPFMTGKISIGPNLLFYRAIALALLVLAFSAIQGAQKSWASQ